MSAGLQPVIGPDAEAFSAPFLNGNSHEAAEAVVRWTEEQV